MASKLELLIAELCPNGVEYKKLGEICTLEKGQTPIQKSVPGEYPLVVTTTERKTSNQYQFCEPTVCVPLISSRGHGVASLSQVYYQEGKFALGNILCGATPKNHNQLNAKFLFYYLNNKKDVLIVPLMRGGANVSLSIDSLKGIKVPVPPFDLQIEIVKILDTFVKLNNSLTAELTARRKQYEFYRDAMIFTEDVPVVELRSVVKNCCAGATPKKGNKAFYEGGTIPWIRTQDVRFNEIFGVDSYITEAAVEKTAAKWIPENCVIVAISGASAGRCAINKIKATTNQHCLNLEIDDTKALYQYIYYCVAGRYEELLSRKQGARGDLNSSLILGITIPLPPLEEQSKIVSKLNKFNKLLSDISVGLPAEITARQKQYEYYRDKLLTFKELNA